MALLTSHCFLPGLEKLAAMNVFVASRAVAGQGFHPNLLTSAIVLEKMAFKADDFAMFSV